MVELVFVDVDGTLVGPGGAVPPDAWAAAERARKAGLRLALCSGRPAFGLSRGYALRLDPDGWHVFQNGASVARLSGSGQGGDESRSEPIAPDAVAGLVERSRRTGRVLELYSDSEYAVESCGRRAEEHAALLGVPFEPRPFGSLSGPVVRAQWLLGPGELEAVLAEPHFDLTLSPSTSPIMPDTTFVNITRPGVDKGTGVAAAAAAAGVPLSRVMMVGDGLNDVAALRAAGHGVAMGNAEPEATAVARYRVAAVDSDGLAEALDLALRLRAG
jgi:Cof subfamily protein (haloacid dehalogenase superfamily)